MRIELGQVAVATARCVAVGRAYQSSGYRKQFNWLENILKTSAGAVVLVSHDRAFIIM